MNWFKENWFRVAILAIILVLGVSYLSYLYSKERNRHAEESQTAEQKATADSKKYLAGRSADCLSIYKVEIDKWNNVLGWRYDETGDTCKIQYKDSKPKSEAECDKLYPRTFQSATFSLDNLNCKRGQFDKSF